MPPAHPLDRRRAGVLCAVRSLPALAAAERFLDFLVAARLRVWQVLPLNPPDRYGSPYHSRSLFALDEALADTAVDAADAAEFRAHAPSWLDDYALYSVAAGHHGDDWTAWPAALRERDGDALEALRMSHGYDAVVARQCAAHARWRRLRAAANARGVLLFGDLPLYPAHASADVWAHRTLFQLDADGIPSAVAGVPPDYFSADGQRWGNPLYAWDRIAATDYAWWCDRVAAQLELFDVVRIDHFRGLAAYWSIPRDAPATAGHWCPAPGAGLLDALARSTPGLPLVAEDLGTITPDVDALRERFGLPCMRVVQFAFSGDPANPHLPAHHPTDAVVYTGTHDNDTALGWYESLPASARRDVDAMLAARGDMPWSLIGVALDSRALTAIVPLQDFLGLGSAARMNTPGTVTGNWRWRFEAEALTPALANRIRVMVEASSRG